MASRLGALAGAAMLVAAPLAAAERQFGAAGEWQVVAGEDGGRTYCAAARQIDGREVRMRFDGDGWGLSLAVGDAPGDVTGFEIDDKTYRLNPHRDGARTVLSLDHPGMEAVRNGTLAVLTLDGVATEVPLNGTAAAALRVEDCLRLQGQPAAVEVELLTTPGDAVAETGPMGPGCPDRSDSASTWEGAPDSVTLRYDLADARPLLLFRVDPFGRLLPEPVAFGPGAETVTLEGHVGQSFVVKDRDGACHGGLIRADGSGREYAIR